MEYGRTVVGLLDKPTVSLERPMSPVDIILNQQRKHQNSKTKRLFSGTAEGSAKKING